MFGFDYGLKKKSITFVILDILGLFVCFSEVHLLEAETLESSGHHCFQVNCKS